MQTWVQRFSHPGTDELFALHMPVVILLIIPVILATMPDMETILEEKDSKVQALTFIMGCSETAYWGVFFVSQLVLALIPYTLIAFMTTRKFILVGTSLSLLMFIFVRLVRTGTQQPSIFHSVIV
jgi:hypothetical protein